MLAQLIAGAPRLALVGLAKNTGKTETLTAILAEHARAARTIGVTSIGRDGEAHDVIDARIKKPRIELQAGSLVAGAGALLRASGVPYERLAQTGVRTPLGEVILARLERSGAIEVAGPSAAEDLRAVCAAMATHGAEQVLIDGSIDRRAASSPAVSDALVLATGAILGREVEQVLTATVEAVELVRLPRWKGTEGDGAHGAGDDTAESAVRLESRTVLRSEPAQIAALLRAHGRADTFLAPGALGERFLEGLLAARRERVGRELLIVAGDPTKIFLSRHSPGWYARQGIALAVRETIDLRAITINPVAPRSHTLDSRALREAIATAIPDVHVVDVREPE